MTLSSDKHISAIAWAESVLKDKGFPVPPLLEHIANTPYSYVARLTCGDAIYYLKQTPPDLFVEAEILMLLKSIYPASAVPVVAASNQDDLCFLLQSCGEGTLRQRFAGVLDIDVLAKGVEAYRLIQQETSKHLNKFLDISIADWRLSRLPALYAELICDKTRLSLWGFTDIEITDLHDKKATFTALCHDIDKLNIRDTLNNSDFQENNMVIDAVGNVSVIDWGEVTIGHPLLSLIGCFKKITRRYAIDPSHADYKKLQSIFLVGTDINEQEVPDIYQSLSALDDIYYALTMAELIKSTENPSAGWAARIKMSCLAFLNSCKTGL